LLDTAIGAPLLRITRAAYTAGAGHHVLTGLLSPNRSRILVSQSAEELENGEGMAIAHDVRRATEV
jgi:GntR family transcriptional regulator